jgi:hypothetical protein
MQQNNLDKEIPEHLGYNPNLLLTGSLVICGGLFFFSLMAWLWTELI